MKKFIICFLIIIIASASAYSIETAKNLVISKSITNVYGLTFQVEMHKNANDKIHTDFITFTQPNYPLTKTQGRSSNGNDTALYWGIGLTVTGMVVSLVGIGFLVASIFSLRNSANQSVAGDTAKSEESANSAFDSLIFGAAFLGAGAVILTPGAVLWRFNR